MKALKTIGIIALALVAVVLVLGLVAPKDYQVERSVVINAPRSTIFPHVQYFEKQLAWSPWAEYDPNMKNDISGTDGTVGAVYHWAGNDQVGEGEQTITALQPNERIETDLHFMKPWESRSTAHLALADADQGTKVTWGISGRMPFPENIFGLFMNMDAMLGKDFDKGLNKLKTIVESTPTNQAAYQVQEMDAPVRYFVGYREKINMDAMTSERFGQYLPKVFAAVQAAKGEFAGQPCGLFFLWDEAGKQVDLAYAVPVKNKIMVKGFDTFEIPAGKRLVVDYYGPYAGTGVAHNALDEYVKANQLEYGLPVWEEYITDPMAEPDTAKWLTKVVYPVK